MQQEYNGIMFDSDQEIMYYQLLKQNGTSFFYQDRYKKTPLRINLGRRKTYVPDFVIWKDQEFKIIELKGWSKWSGNEDNAIMDFMKNKVLTDQTFLKNWLKEIGFPTPMVNMAEVKYQRLKYLKGLGFVDYDFKNPNSLINQKRRKVKEQQDEIKQLKAENKLLRRYYELSIKDSLNKSQMARLEEIKAKLNQGE